MEELKFVMSDKTVFIGSPCHNKVHAIEAHLRCIENLNYPKDKISLVYLLNDSVDGTKEIVVDYLGKLKDTNQYARVEIHEQNFGHIDGRLADVRKGYNYGLYSLNEDFSHFATVRNIHKDFLQDEDYFFSVDCDVLVKPNSLKMLMDSGRDFIGQPVNNQENRESYPNAKWPNSNYNIAILTKKGYRMWKNFPWNEILEVDLTGACVLMKAEIAKKIQYRAHPFGEDAGFVAFVKAYGYQICTNSFREYDGEDVLPVHAMDYLPREMM